jgi:hypothetical protein
VCSFHVDGFAVSSDASSFVRSFFVDLAVRKSEDIDGRGRFVVRARVPPRAAPPPPPPIFL